MGEGRGWLECDDGSFFFYFLYCFFDEGIFTFNLYF